MTKILIPNIPNTFQEPGTCQTIKRSLSSAALAVALILLHADAGAAQAPVDLRSAGRFAVLAASDITSVPTSAIKGDVGLSPAARSRIAGLTPVEVTGSIFAADDGGAVAVMLTGAQGDLTTAYNDAAGRVLDPVSVPNADLGGLTLPPGLYKSTGTLAITGTLTLDGQGDPNAVFIFQMASSLDTASGSQVILIGGAKAANIYWQVGTSATLGTTTMFKGTIMADQSIALATGATLEGRALARIGAVTMEANSITLPAAAAQVVLVAAAEVAGQYMNAAGHSVNQAAKTITVPISGATQFYQITSGAALSISNISVANGSVVIVYR